MQTLEWKRTYPASEGFFFYRVNMAEDPEVIEVYTAGRKHGIHRYGWCNLKILLGKRMHDPEAVTADELSGFYLVVPGTRVPVPITVTESEQKAAKKKAAKKKPCKPDEVAPAPDSTF